jgi:hypothetical protein
MIEELHSINDDRKLYVHTIRMFDWINIMKVPGLATVISVLLGFGLAALFRPLCKGPDCLIMRGPPVTDIRGAVYQFGSKCVEFVPKPIACPAKTDTAVKVVETMMFADAS